MTLKSGDIFSVPIEPNLIAYGQILAKNKPVFYMAAYDYLSEPDAPLNVDVIISKPILFLGNFFDSLFKTGQWKVVGNSKLDLSKIPFPKYKVQIEENYFVESWDMCHRRQATPHEIMLLDFRRHIGPIVLENAIKAYHKKIAWNHLFDSLTYEHVLKRSEVVL